MATIALSVAGMAVGGSIGGSVLGLSMATIGRAAGAAIGRRIDQQLLGGGSDAVETGRVDRFRLTGASEGTDIQQIYGRMRIAGQVIWASHFKERKKTTGGGGGKGSRPSEPEITTYSYTVSMAIGLCDGEISRIGRIWADGVELARNDLNMRVYHGTENQLPDPKISAVEGADNAPAYRGTAYVVFEDLPLGQFGNRIPQFSFEVSRPAAPDAPADQQDLHDAIRGVALIPGTGEYALATTPVYLSAAFGEQLAINTNSPMGRTDFQVSMDTLEEELPSCKSVVLVVSWFGDDLRCGACSVRPKVEQRDTDAGAMPWRVSGQTRAAAVRVPSADNAPVYGGTPTDTSVVEAIQNMRARGLEPVFYPFILMDQLADNTLPDPWSGDVGQAALPWRGRITTSLAPTVSGTPDGTQAVIDEVAAFMGTASVADFSIDGDRVDYNGPDAWGYRRFILHYAHLCAAAGGVSAFCIGSEMRGLTQIRGPGNTFPAVDALRVLAAEVRGVLGPDCKISYAADWSEYHGYQPVGTDDKLFHLDPLWADPNIDFIGVDNYMPLSDWRDGDGHADQSAGSIYNLDYLKANIAGGEGYDWYYTTTEARDAQRRTAITDSAGEPWVWRYKDFEGWWGNAHHNRINGIRQATPTAWQAQSKPIWFTEFGCSALDKGTNQPNKFIDPKSSESQVPYYSNGNRDDFIQMQYVRAMSEHFADAANNPASTEYEGQMVAADRMHVWAWDARPYPFFPGNRSLWSDGGNYARGHWVNGRATNRSLASVVAEICTRSGVTQFDVSRLYGAVRGYVVPDAGSARAALQPLMTTYGFEAAERDGLLVFKNRVGAVDHVIAEDSLALDSEQDRSIALTRAPAAEIAGRVQLAYLTADGDFAPAASEIVHPDETSFGIARSEVPLALTRNEGRHTVSRWIEEARVARDTASFALPPSRLDVGPGDVVSIETDDHDGLYRIDRIEEAGLRLAEATRINGKAYLQQNTLDEDAVLQPYTGPVPVEMLFMDLPVLTGDENETAPHLAASSVPWPGSVALYSAAQDSDYQLRELINDASAIGLTHTALQAGPSGIWDRQAGFEIALINGELSSTSVQALLGGANVLAIGDGTPDQWEIVQFREATPVAPNRFALRGLLRGQLGTRGLMPDVWPVGSRVVVLDGTPSQIALASSARGVTRHFRYGPASAAMDAPSYKYETHAFQGNGLRPYPVAHLRGQNGPSGVTVSWIRSSRIDGDLWSGTEIPLGEETEAYQLRVVQNDEIRREETVTQPNWTYAAAEAVAEVGTSPYQIEVAQLSARYGPGLSRNVQIDPSAS